MSTKRKRHNHQRYRAFMRKAKDKAIQADLKAKLKEELDRLAIGPRDYIPIGTGLEAMSNPPFAVIGRIQNPA